MFMRTLGWLVAAGALVQPVLANTLLDNYRHTAKAASPDFSDFSATAGHTLYNMQVGETSCASCHSASPKSVGKHVKTGKAIEPMAPVANPRRLTDPVQVEKWFKRNCNDVLKRSCTLQEKGDFVAYLLSVR